MRRRELLKVLGNAAIAWPFVAHAQSKVYRVGLLTLEAGEDASQFVGKLRDLGYVEGKNLQYVHRSAEGDPKRLAALAAELVQLKPDVLVAGWGTLAPKTSANDPKRTSGVCVARCAFETPTDQRPFRQIQLFVRHRWASAGGGHR